MNIHKLGKGILYITAGWVLSTVALAGPISDSLQGGLYSLKNGKLEPFDTSKLGEIKTFAVYFSAEWCPPCRAFTPDLVQFYDRVKKSNPEFELIFVSRDKSLEEMVGYMKGTRMKWPATEFEKKTYLQKYGGRGIPNLVVVDENGTILSSSYEGDNYRGPRAVLEDLGKILSKQKKANQASKPGTDFGALLKPKMGAGSVAQ